MLGGLAEPNLVLACALGFRARIRPESKTWTHLILLRVGVGLIDRMPKACPSKPENVFLSFDIICELIHKLTIFLSFINF